MKCCVTEWCRQEVVIGPVRTCRVPEEHDRGIHEILLNLLVENYRPPAKSINPIYENKEIDPKGSLYSEE